MGDIVLMQVGLSELSIGTNLSDVLIVALQFSGIPCGLCPLS